MRYRNVTLTDFGIYQNTRVDDLPNGLGVVAGPQRAGKTTFMQALRQLPFGINRGDDLPPASQDYELGATIEHDDAAYTLRVSGHQSPTIGSLDDAPERELSKVVGGLTKDQYQQLFTLSLRELQRMPDSLDDEEQLSEILLGAAYGDISAVPALREQFGSDAKSIGGKYGRSVSQLGDVVDDIAAAVEDREAAKETVDEYERQQAALHDIESEIEELDAQEAELADEKIRLSVLEKRFEDLERYWELQSEFAEYQAPAYDYPDGSRERAVDLQAELDEAATEVASARADLDTPTEDDEISAYADRLLDAAATIERYDRQVEKWRGKEADFEETEAELGRRRGELVARVTALRSDWSSLEAVRTANADTFTKETVRATTTEVEDLQDELETTRQAAAAKQREIDELEQELETAESELESQADEQVTSSRGVPLGAAIALVGLGIGAAVGFATAPIAGYVIAAIGIGAGFLYLRSQLESSGPELDVEPVRELKRSLADRRSEVAGLEDELEALEDELEAAEAEFDTLRDQFDVPGTVPPAGVREFYDQFETLQADIRRYDADMMSYAADERAFYSTLTEVAADLDGLATTNWEDGGAGNTEALYTAVEQAAAAVDVAEELSSAQKSLGYARSEAIAILASWTQSTESPRDEVDLEQLSTAALIDELSAYESAAETAARYHELESEIEALEARMQREFRRSSVVEAFEPTLSTLDGPATADTAPAEESDDEHSAIPAIPLLEHIADQYATDAEITARIEDIESSLDDIHEDREQKRTRRAEITETLRTLASDDDLKAAEATIQRHRERLQTLGERYAVNRMAETLLDELHDQFLEQATGPLLDEASEIFSRITDTYEGVSHAGDLDSLRFEALHTDGNNRAPESLSRATAEQLFLSIRLARIRQFDEPLPVVIDDAMTNFDPAHTRRTLAFLDELARTHQILLLTCHPEVIRLTDEMVTVEGYWTLQNGQFEGPNRGPNAAIEFLDTN